MCCKKKKILGAKYYFIKEGKKLKAELTWLSYIENTLGEASELHCTQDHDAGKHGSPPSCAQPSCGYRDTMLAMIFAVDVA
jgi:hypothetical protein